MTDQFGAYDNSAFDPNELQRQAMLGQMAPPSMSGAPSSIQTGGYQAGYAPSPQQPSAPIAPSPAPDNRAGIASAYQQFLGRAPGESDYQAWTGNNDYQIGRAHV